MVVCVAAGEGMRCRGGRGSGSAAVGGAAVLSTERDTSGYDGRLCGGADRGGRGDAAQGGTSDRADVGGDAACAGARGCAVVANGRVVASRSGLGTRCSRRGGGGVQSDRRVLGGAKNREFAAQAVDLDGAKSDNASRPLHIQHTTASCSFSSSK
jgi:hypothetical protein